MWEIIGYHPEDFLLFSRSIYYDLIASYNRSLWPLHAISVFVFSALIIFACMSHRNRKFELALLFSFTLSLLLIAKVYFLDYFSTINWASKYLAVGFFIECALLVFEMLGSKGESQSIILKRYAIFCFIFVILVLPGIEFLLHRRLALMPIIGLDPDITMMALVVYGVFFRLSLQVVLIPIVWLILSVIMHHTMEAQKYLMSLLFLCCFVLFAGYSSFLKLRLFLKKSA